MRLRGDLPVRCLPATRRDRPCLKRAHRISSRLTCLGGPDFTLERAWAFVDSSVLQHAVPLRLNRSQSQPRCKSQTPCPLPHTLLMKASHVSVLIVVLGISALHVCCRVPAAAHALLLSTPSCAISSSQQPERNGRSKNALSVQAEATTVTQAVQLFYGERLEDGSREGFFLRDGAGEGKGRQISAILKEMHCRGTRRILWLSHNSDLREEARRDMTDMCALASCILCIWYLLACSHARIKTETLETCRTRRCLCQ